MITDGLRSGSVLREVARLVPVTCSPKLEPFFGGYEAVGSCGGDAPRCRARFGANEVVTEKCFSTKACAEFREKVLAVFGPGGSRKLVTRDDAKVAGYCPPELLPSGEAALYPSLADRLRAVCREGLNWKPPKAKG